jgi:hypothetical protein
VLFHRSVTWTRPTCNSTLGRRRHQIPVGIEVGEAYHCFGALSVPHTNPNCPLRGKFRGGGALQSAVTAIYPFTGRIWNRSVPQFTSEEREVIHIFYVFSNSLITFESSRSIPALDRLRSHSGGDVSHPALGAAQHTEALRVLSGLITD